MNPSPHCATNSEFEKFLSSRHPGVFFSALATMLEQGRGVESLSQVGIPAARVAAALDALGAQDFTPAASWSGNWTQAVGSFARAVAASRIAPGEQGEIEEALSRLQARMGPSACKLADLNSPEWTSLALAGPGWPTWAASRCCQLHVPTAWEAFAGRGAAGQAMRASPEAFFDQAMNFSELPASADPAWDWAAQLPADQLVAYARRMFSKDDDMKRQGMDLAEAICDRLDNAAGEAKSCAILEQLIPFWIERPDLDPGLARMSSIMSLANLGHPDAIPAIARAASSIALHPALRCKRTSGPAPGEVLSACIRSCDGARTLALPLPEGSRLPRLTLADYALGLAGQPDPQPQKGGAPRRSHCPVLDEIAREMREQGLDAEPRRRGGPAAVLQLAKAQRSFDEGELDAARLRALIESLCISVETEPASDAPARPRMRI